MKNKIILSIATLISLGFMTTAEAATYDTREDFIKAEGEICAVATDGINTFFGEDFQASTLMAGPDGFQEEWKCVQTKAEAKKEEFIKNLDKDCEMITDGVNNFWGEDFEISTRIGYPKDFTAEWSCVENENDDMTKEEFIKSIDGKCEAITDGVNTFFGEDYEASTMVGYPEDFTPKWSCVENENLTDSQVEELDKIETKLPNFIIKKLDKGSETIVSKINDLEDTEANKALERVESKLMEIKTNAISKHTLNGKLNWFGEFLVDVVTYLDLKVKSDIK